MRALFVCARNRLRSPTAEVVFGQVPGWEVSSAGTAPDAECIIGAEQIEWADAVFVMENRQRTVLKQRFGKALAQKRVVCLRIPDRYSLMQSELVDLSRQRMEPWLRAG